MTIEEIIKMLDATDAKIRIAHQEAPYTGDPYFYRGRLRDARNKVQEAISILLYFVK